jgi:hypothetical protein
VALGFGAITVVGHVPVVGFDAMPVRFITMQTAVVVPATVVALTAERFIGFPAGVGVRVVISGLVVSAM